MYKYNNCELNIDILFSKPVCDSMHQTEKSGKGDSPHSVAPICMTDDQAATICQWLGASSLRTTEIRSNCR